VSIWNLISLCKILLWKKYFVPKEKLKKIELQSLIDFGDPQSKAVRPYKLDND